MAGSFKVQENGAVGYWDSYLAGVTACHLPCLGGENEGARQKEWTKVDLEHSQELQELFAEDRQTFPGVVCAAWALVLRCYLGSEDVCFGYREEREDNCDTQTKGSRASFKAMHIARMSFDETASLISLVEKAKGDYTSSLSHQHEAPTRALEALRLSENQLFNTALWTWRNARPEDFISSREPLDMAHSDQVSCHIPCASFLHLSDRCYSTA